MSSPAATVHVVDDDPSVLRSLARLKGDRELASIRSRICSLSPRECEVFRWVIAGRLNKQTASEMGIGEKTVKFHRAVVMRKMKAGSVAELTILADRAGVAPMRKVGPAHIPEEG